jgi:alkylation response protein AidB-like acyl-CoA dehydrogenase
MEGDRPALDADGLPVALLVHCGPDAVRIDDNWHTLGLRGTGSYDYTLNTPELFVPDGMCYLYAASRPLRGGPAYSIGLIGLTAGWHSSWALRIGRRILDELAGLARTKGGPLGLIGDSVAFRQAYADAEARFRSARAFCLDSWADLDAVLATGEPPSLQQIALVRMAMRHLHDVLSDIATFAHRAAGGASLRAGLLQRCYRDVHSGTQHVLLADQIYQACGQVLLGLTGAGAHWGLFGVLE